MKVISLKKIKNKYEVIFDSGYTILTDEDFIVKYRLVKDKEIDNLIFNNIKKEYSYTEYKTRLFKYINSYLKSEYEYRIYLKRIETPLAAIDLIINEFKELGYINDYNYAKMAINHYLKSYGRKMIIYKLRESKVADEIINELIASIDEDVYYENLKKNILKKISGTLDYKQRVKIIKVFINKGYEYDIINNIISEME